MEKQYLEIVRELQHNINTDIIVLEQNLRILVTW